MRLVEKNDLEKVLELIAMGDPAQLLAQENLVEIVNELSKNGLVEIKDGKICLTPAGEELKRKGGRYVMQKVSVDNEFTEFSAKSQKTGNIIFLISLFACLLSFLILLFIHLLS